MKKLLMFSVVLMLWFSPCSGESHARRGGVSVEITSLKPFRLHVSLRSGELKRVSIDRSELPWATRYGMLLVAVKENGEWKIAFDKFVENMLKDLQTK